MSPTPSPSVSVRMSTNSMRSSGWSASGQSTSFSTACHALESLTEPGVSATRSYSDTPIGSPGCAPSRRNVVRCRVTRSPAPTGCKCGAAVSDRSFRVVACPALRIELDEPQCTALGRPKAPQAEGQRQFARIAGTARRPHPLARAVEHHVAGVPGMGRQGKHGEQTPTRGHRPARRRRLRFWSAGRTRLRRPARMPCRPSATPRRAAAFDQRLTEGLGFPRSRIAQAAGGRMSRSRPSDRARHDRRPPHDGGKPMAAGQRLGHAASSRTRRRCGRPPRPLRPRRLRVRQPVAPAAGDASDGDGPSVPCHE